MNHERWPWWLRLVDALYAAMLLVYPREFRREFGEEMRRTLREQCRDLARASWRVRTLALIDTLGDWGRGIGNEHWLAWRERGFSRLSLLWLFLFMTGAMWFLRAPVQLAIEDYVRAAPERKIARDMASYLDSERRAAARLVARGDPTSHVLAGLFYRDVATDESHRFSRAGMHPPGDAAQLLAQADASFEHAWHARELNSATLWFMATRCDPGSACDPVRALRVLASREPGNAAVLRLVLATALRAGDESLARQTLAEMARATRANSFPGMRLGLFADRMDVLADRDLRQSMSDWSGMDAAARPRSLERTMAMWFSQGFGVALDVESTSTYCRPESPGSTSRREDCLAMARVFAERGSRFTERTFGCYLQLLWLAGTPDAVRPLAQLRYLMWLSGARDRVFKDKSLDVARVEVLTGVWVAALRESDNEIDAAEALLRAAGRSLDPSVDDDGGWPTNSSTL